MAETNRFEDRFPIVEAIDLECKELKHKLVIPRKFTMEYPPPEVRKCADSRCAEGVFRIWGALAQRIDLGETEIAFTIRCDGTTHAAGICQSLFSITGTITYKE